MLYIGIITFALFSSIPATAQLEMSGSVGNINIGVGSVNSNHKLSVQYNLSNTRKYALYVENTSTGSINSTAVWVENDASAGNGFGGRFYGGYTGVYGNAATPGSGTRRGIYGVAFDGDSNQGAFVWAKSTDSNDANYGIYATVTPAAGDSTNNYAGYFNGDIFVVGSILPTSDARLKDNITTLDRTFVLEKLMQLRPTSYRFKTTGEYASMNLSSGNQYGLLAQEVETVFPEFVSDHQHPGALDEEGNPKGEPISFKSVNTSQLIPLLLAAIQEQQERIEALEAALNNR